MQIIEQRTFLSFKDECNPSSAKLWRIVWLLALSWDDRRSSCLLQMAEGIPAADWLVAWCHWECPLVIGCCLVPWKWQAHLKFLEFLCAASGFEVFCNHEVSNEVRRFEVLDSQPDVMGVGALQSDQWAEVKVLWEREQRICFFLDWLISVLPLGLLPIRLSL